MSQYRFVNSDFWSDIWVVDHLNPLDRYLFMYLFTNKYMNLIGVYELSLRIMSFETGIEREQLLNMLKRLEPRVKYVDGWVILQNAIKHQNYKNSNIHAGMIRVANTVNSEILQHVKWPKDFGEKPPIGTTQTSLLDDPTMTQGSTVTVTEPNLTTTVAPKPVDKSVNSNSRTTGLKKGMGKQYLEVDALYEDLHDLVNDKFKAWYCSSFFKIGREKVQRLASEAKADTNGDAKKLFSHLLREELGKVAK